MLYIYTVYIYKPKEKKFLLGKSNLLKETQSSGISGKDLSDVFSTGSLPY